MKTISLMICLSIAVGGLTAFSQTPPEDAAKQLVPRLDLERYKATIKGLTEFGDRREGTEQNRKAVDWIQRQLESYGCLTDRIRYVYQSGVREQVFCTKIGTKSSEEMYIIAAHMDGQGGAGAAGDNASGTAAVMELARILNMLDVQTDRSIRFVFWNNGEAGQEGRRAYINQRMDLQGKEDYPGSGSFPEGHWQGLVELDMGMLDHGTPSTDGSLSAEQRPDAHVNIRVHAAAKFSDQAMKLASLFRDANEKYAADYRAVVSRQTTNNDSTPLMDLLPTITLRQPADVYSTDRNKEFRLSLNAAQTTLGAMAQLAGARLKQ